MDTVSITTTSDTFSTVMGFLHRFVQIGDTIAEVNIPLYVLFLHSDYGLLAGSSICETCVDGADGCGKGLCHLAESEDSTECLYILSADSETAAR
jgi:hypothetical protein